MSDLFADRLVEAIESKKSAICVGIDPMFEMLPEAIAGDPRKRNANDAPACIDAIFAFTIKILQIVAPHVPVVKFQSAFFEKYLWEGVEAYYSLIQEAAEMNLLVIGDVKRGDIGSTAAAYAAGHLAEPPFDDPQDRHDDHAGGRESNSQRRCSHVMMAGQVAYRLDRDVGR